MGRDAADRFFVVRRRQDTAATTWYGRYDHFVSRGSLVTKKPSRRFKMWKADGWKFALICDEIHHTNEIDSSWGDYVEGIKNLAAYSIFMSGTYFRSDHKPITCVFRLTLNGNPIKDYRFTYSQGVKENVVRGQSQRATSTQRCSLYDKAKDRKYQLMLNEVGNRELSEARKQVLDPHGECIRHIIETVFTSALLQNTHQIPADAACLFVCRPGGGENFSARDDDSFGNGSRRQACASDRKSKSRTLLAKRLRWSPIMIVIPSEK